MTPADLVCWEALDPDCPSVAQARALYEATQPPDERIPWHWIARSLARRKSWRPGRWAAHLFLAAARSAPATVTGFANALHLPGFGGYLTYVGVDPSQRARGTGSRLVELAVRALRVDSWCEGVELPFVVWESRPPGPGGDRAAWAARLGLWRRAGALWVSGLTLHAVNYERPDAPPLRLALFLRPAARPAADFDADALRAVAAGLLRMVYECDEGGERFARTLPADCRPALRPPDDAAGLTLAGE